jgi:hypothetical protein
LRRSILWTALAVVLAGAFAVSASASNGIGMPPPAPFSQAFAEGGADVSDGTTPQTGLLFGLFEKGDESYNGSQTTTVVNFTLPPGVSIHNDPVECSGLPNNDCIIIIDSTCDGGTISPSGNEIEFRIACDPGEGFIWEALVDSLITTPGAYDLTAQFKVGVLKRAKDATNMWQIKDSLTGSFCVACS